MDALRRVLGALPGPGRCALIGALLLGVAGGAAGLVIGLRTYVPTAWAATFELGLPAAFVGAVLGSVVGALGVTVRRASP